MRMRRRQFGLTLTELVVTVAIAAVLMAVAVPAAKRLTEAMRDSGGSRALISAALSNARAIAVRQGKYAGVWFYRGADAENTYMVLMVHDERPVPDGGTGLANGFRPVEGRKAILLPEGVILNVQIGETQYAVFSVVFNAAGKLVTRPVRFWGTLPIVPPLFYDLGGDITSVNMFQISDSSGLYKTLMVSPYTGELIGD